MDEADVAAGELLLDCCYDVDDRAAGAARAELGRGEDEYERLVVRERLRDRVPEQGTVRRDARCELRDIASRTAQRRCLGWVSLGSDSCR